MKIESFKCDRCGSVIPKETVGRGIIYTSELLSRTCDDPFDCFDDDSVDLCPECMYAFTRWLRFYKDDEEHK